MATSSSKILIFNLCNVYRKRKENLKGQLKDFNDQLIWLPQGLRDKPQRGPLGRKLSQFFGREN
jgi:hypothetical protein